MIQIIDLNPGISVAGVNYPNNTLTFKIIKGRGGIEEIEIKNINGKVLYNAPYTDFMDSSNTVYSTAAAVITALRGSYS